MNEGRRPSNRSLPLAVLALTVATVAGWAIGLEWGPALLVGLSLVAVLGLRRIPPGNSDEEWPAAPEVGTDHGVRREVTRLSWHLHGYESRVERPSLVRLRAVADRRLAARGRRLSDPGDAAACRALLGPGAYRVLTADRGTAVTFDEFTATLDTLDHLSAEERP